MTVLEEVEISLSGRDFNNMVWRPWPNEPRPKGVHLSGCLDVLEKAALGSKSQQNKNEINEENYPTIVFLGHLWEAGCVGLYEEIDWQPETLSRDGITGTRDGVSNQFVGEFTGEKGKSGWATVIEEFKYTTKGIRSFAANASDPALWRYIRQGLGYCAMTQPTATPANHVRYHICWAKGDWGKTTIWPTYTRILVRFDQQEIDRFWKTVLNVKERAKPE